MKRIGIIGHKDNLGYGAMGMTTLLQRPAPPLIQLDAAALARLGVRPGQTSQLLLPADELLVLAEQSPAALGHPDLRAYLHRERGRLVALVPAGAAGSSLFRFITS